MTDYSYNIEDPSIIDKEDDDLYTDNFNYYKEKALSNLENDQEINDDLNYNYKDNKTSNELKSNNSNLNKSIIKLKNKNLKELTVVNDKTLITNIQIKGSKDNEKNKKNIKTSKSNTVTIKPASINNNTTINNSNKILDYNPINYDTNEEVIYNKMKQFEKMLKSNINNESTSNKRNINNNNNNNLEKLNSNNSNLKNIKEVDEYYLSEEEDLEKLKEAITEVELSIIDKKLLHKKYCFLQKKYIESQKQITEIQKLLHEERTKQKDLIDTLSKEVSSDIKEKKLVDLVKKNTDLNLKIEKFKLKDKEYEKQIKKLESQLMNQNTFDAQNNNNNVIGINTNNSFLQNNNSSSNNNNNNNINLLNINDEYINTKKKLKQTESRIAELNNKNTQLKNENIKLDSLLKKEIGENYYTNLNELDKNWKGRAEIIEVLKGKVKLYENIISTANYNIKQEIEQEEKLNQNLTINKTMMKNNNLSNNSNLTITNNLAPLNINHTTLSKLSSNTIQFSQYKKEKEQYKKDIENLTVEKEKLIQENLRFKSRKEVLERELKLQKESLTSKLKVLIEKNDNDEKLINILNKELEKRTGKNIQGDDVVFNLKQEILSLKEKLKIKTEEITKLENKNNSLGNKPDVSVIELLDKILKLEEENKELKLNSDGGKIYESLARENAKLRLKLYQKDSSNN